MKVLLTHMVNQSKNKHRGWVCIVIVALVLIMHWRLCGLLDSCSTIHQSYMSLAARVYADGEEISFSDGTSMKILICSAELEDVYQYPGAVYAIDSENVFYKIEDRYIKPKSVVYPVLTNGCEKIATVKDFVKSPIWCELFGLNLVVVKDWMEENEK